MSGAELRLAGTRFAPGEEISGETSWHADRAPHNVALRLFWRTSGRAESDSETVWETNFEAPLAEDRRSFTLAAPHFPPSFSGRLVSLAWAIELVIDGKSCAKVEEIVIAPGGVELNLQRPEWLAVEAPWDTPKILWLRKT